MFASVRHWAQLGKPIKCGDGVLRIFWPALLVASLDYEEAVHFLCCRASSANFPCPRCLVPNTEQHLTLKKSKPRTSKAMSEVLARARKADSADLKLKILMDHGLHDTPVSALLFAVMNCFHILSLQCTELRLGLQID
jgi:hypothetical protein